MLGLSGEALARRDERALPRQTAWLGELEVELLLFSNGRHGDQVDSLS